MDRRRCHARRRNYDRRGSLDAHTLHGALAGDANLDGTVDINDLTIVLTNFGRSGMAWNEGDFNGNGNVDVNDLTIVLSNYGDTAGSPSAAAVPEPSALALLAASAAALFAFGWWKR